MSDSTETERMPREARLHILQGQRAGLAELTAAQIHALQGDVTDADAIARGTATVAAEVVDEVSSALVRVDFVALVSARGDAMRYPKFRARYLLDLLFELVRAHEAQSSQGSAWMNAQDALAREVLGARAVRNSLLFGLRQAAQPSAAFAADVARIQGRATRPELLSASLTQLARHVADWLADPARAPILEAGAVGPADVTAANAAATSLEAARQRVYTFPAASRDLPHTNLVEGRLMIELSRLYRALEAHQGILAALPRLPLGDTLRRELRRVASEDDTLSDPLPEPEPTPAA